MKLDQVTDALPEQVVELVKYLIEGRIKQLVVIAELDNGCILDGMQVIDDDANRYVMAGALAVAQRDYLRLHVQSRVEYLEDREADNDDD